MSREKLQMNTVSVDQLFIILNKHQTIEGPDKSRKYNLKANPNHQSYETKDISIRERNEILTKKIYNNIKSFKHSNRFLQKTMKDLKLTNCSNNPQYNNFQIDDKIVGALPQNYRAFPKRESPLKNNNPAKFFLATQPKKLHQRLQQNSIIEMDSKIYMLVNSSFSNSRIKDQTRRVRNLLSQRRQQNSVIRSEESPRCLVLEETISLMKVPKEKIINLSQRTLTRPKTSSHKFQNKKYTIEPWQNYQHCEQFDIANNKDQ